MIFSGRNCLITGANTGLGLAVSKKIAAKGANTILLCRNEKKGNDAVLEIKKETPDASVELMICDLASIESIQSFAKDFKEKNSRLDILYNNAAVMKKKRTVTEDGFELMFQVNYLAPFIFMNSFLELLKKGSSSVVLNNGRPADKMRLDMDDLQFLKKYSMYNSFFRTKLCLLFATFEFSRRHESDGLSTFMADPGPFKSNLVRDIPLAGRFKNIFSAPVEKASENLLFHLASNELKQKNGKVFKEKLEYPLNEYWKDTNVSERLWFITESLLKNG